MENNQTNNKEQRVVLNLSMSQAKQLKELLLGAHACAKMQDDTQTQNIADKLLTRIAKTITKHESYMEHEAFKMAEDQEPKEAEDGNL